MTTDPKDLEALGILLRVVAEALESDTGRAELMKDPKAVLARAGFELDDDVEVEVHENTETKLHIVLPARLDDLDERRRHHRLLNWWPV